MRRYETFNPTIPEEPELPSKADGLPVYEELPDASTIKNSSKESSRRKKNPDKTVKKKEKKEKKGFVKSIVGFFQSRTLRWLVGLFLALFAVYLGIAFISYFTTCIKDQAEINNTPIGQSADVANAAGEGGAQ